ncbi:MAG: transcriptional regulator [Alphaproteobacteria bacterium RIFOXYD12_FULL_60_8]|nr:MAG: transcriptional regulator [Alphaproteobacteria bacterium RIFOXYD12_FULL_60_8]
MTTKSIKVGIASHAQLKQRAVEIAQGSRQRSPSEPKVWFTSIESLAKILSESNRAVLKVIDQQHPTSLKELETLTGRKVSNLSRTLKTMSQHGLVSLEPGKKGTLIPKVLFKELHLDLPLVS